MTRHKLVARCVDIPQAKVQDLFDLYDADREVSFNTFARYCDWQPWARSTGYAIGAERGLHLGKDHCVRFYRSTWRGRPCYHMDWSAIDHIYQEASK